MPVAAVSLLRARPINRVRYQTKTDPSSNATDATYQRIFTIERFVVEDHVFELRDKRPGEFGAPIAFELSDKEQIQDPPPYWFGEVIIRGNEIRHVDGEIVQ